MRRFHGLGVRLVVVALEGLQTRELGEGRLDGVSNQAAIRRGLRLPRQPVRRYEAVAVQAENVSRRWSSAVCSGRQLLPSQGFELGLRAAGCGVAPFAAIEAGSVLDINFWLSALLAGVALLEAVWAGVIRLASGRPLLFRARGAPTSLRLFPKNLRRTKAHTSSSLAVPLLTRAASSALNAGSASSAVFSISSPSRK